MVLIRSLRWISLSMLSIVAACNDAPTGPVRPEQVATVTVTGSAIIPANSGNPPALQLTPNMTFRLSAAVSDQSGRVNAGYPVDWTSSNPTVFTVDSTGTVTGLKAGQGTVTATARGTTVRGTLVVFVSVAVSSAVAPAGDGEAPKRD